MNTKGFTLIEGAIAGGLVLVLAVPMLLGVIDTRRRADDAERVSSVRQVQAFLETYRARTASYPGAAEDLRSDEAELAQAFGYEAQPPGCGAHLPVTCLAYRLQFVMKGPLGTLSGGMCTASPQGLSCSL